MSDCAHGELILEPSPASEEAGYVTRTAKQLRNAARVDVGSRAGAELTAASDAMRRDLYPTPLVLPEDELFYDPEYDPQSFTEWQALWSDHYKAAKRRKIYVVPPPRISKEVSFMKTWSKPAVGKSAGRVVPPRAEDVFKYVEAFYHGIECMLLPPSTLTFAAWSPGSKDVALQTKTEGVRIRARDCRDERLPKQLNLSDLLDVAMSVVPDDALALIILVHQDMYEDEEDVFCCGRAFGGSHVCVVSTARYHPLFDEVQAIDRHHSWPASHCKAFVERHREDYAAKHKSKKRKQTSTKVKKKIHESTEHEQEGSPLHAALSAFSSVDFSRPKVLTSTWLWRVCRTASHELGHCLGMDHCVYYACIMQGTASAAEDTRQPPYLCPVDEAKLEAITAERSLRKDRSRYGRHKAMLAYCQAHGDGGAFAAYQAWLEARLSDEIEVVELDCCLVANGAVSRYRAAEVPAQAIVIAAQSKSVGKHSAGTIYHAQRFLHRNSTSL